MKSHQGGGKGHDMKQIKKRRRLLRLNNPIGLTVLCIACLAVIVGLYLLIAFLVRKAPAWIEGATEAITHAEATVSPSGSTEPTPTPFMTVEATSENTPVVGTPAVEETPDPNATPSPSPTPFVDPSSPLYGVTVGIDPYRDANSKYQAESEYNLAFANKLVAYLQGQGATVVITRTANDVVMSDAERVGVLNNANCDVVVRLLCNHVDSGKTRGTYMQTTKSSAAFAEAMVAAYTAATELPTRKDNGYEIKATDFLVDCKCSALNIILGHWTNKADLELLENEEFQYKMAEGICNGIVAYLAQKKG